MRSPASAPDPSKPKRAPGRPKAAAPQEVTLQLRLDRGRAERLAAHAAATGLSRSAVLRAALDGVQVLHAQPSAEQREHYRQLVKLATNLNQLVVLAHVGQEVQAQARAALDQVQQLLTALTPTAPPR